MERVERAEQRPGLLRVDNETTSSATRVTVGGKTITYKMNVIQQPLRARACGQGAKSSADRRPVDPPPIVELKIFEGEKAENDITFTMHANYFLYAELQHARAIAQGRVSQERSMPPVLTGTPVAGIAYLDRPNPAGYFIFPDLSVRHEGKYRLSFSLFEELKDPKDADKPQEGSQPDAAGEYHVNHRLEVKSEAFIVYSAKKFPGLTESTGLSRMVAEQGCRVRIRRDVRMRRRDPKSGGKDWDEYEDETSQARARMSATPDPNMYAAMPTMEPGARPRSPSNASLQSNLSRRPSLQDINQAYPSSQYGTPNSNGYVQSSPYGPAPGPQLQQAPMPPPPQFNPQAYPAPPPMPAGPVHQHNHYATPPLAQTQYASQARPYEPAQPSHRPGVEFSGPAKQEYRRSSIPNAVPIPLPTAQHMSQPPPPPPPAPIPTYSQPDSYNRPPPREMMRTNGSSAPIHGRSSFDLPPLNTTIASVSKMEASSPVSALPPNHYSNYYQQAPESNKRSYGNVFSDRHQNQPLRHGARPTSYGDVNRDNDMLNGAPFMPASDDTEEDDMGAGELDFHALTMRYRRADGRRIHRALPPQS